MLGLIILAIIVGVAALVCYILMAVKLTGKTRDHVVAEIKSFIAYNLIGVEGVFDDVINRSTNYIEPMEKSGRIAVITGGTRGIGAEVIKLLLQCDMKVIMGCRRIPDGEEILSKIRQEGVNSGELQVLQLDTSSLASVREFATNVRQDHAQIHYLINNAGIMLAPYNESVDGYESQFATNYLGHYLLTHLLMPNLVAAGTVAEYARIVNVSSCVYSYGKINFEDINNKMQYVSFEAYAQSKLAQLYFTRHLNTQLLADDANVQAHAVHPGVVNTDLFQYTALQKYAQCCMNVLFKKPIQGAYPIVYATIAPQLERKGGTYISNCRIQELYAHVKKPEVEAKLFEYTKSLLRIDNFGKD